MDEKTFSFKRIDIPVERPVIDKLLEFWRGIFGNEHVLNQNLYSILSGKERNHNRDFLFIAQHKTSIISTVHLTISEFDKRIGGIGEVATLKQYRGKGIAKALCSIAIKTFEDNGGKWLFLGTSNPVAARLYYSLGWHYIMGTKIMLRNSSGKSPEVFLRQYFSAVKNNKIRILQGDSRFRLQIIPLVIIPYDEPVLDLNAGLFSTRWYVQRSCMGLYPHYEKLEEHGAWFVAISGKFLAGIVSIVFHDKSVAQIDGFCIPGIDKKVMLNLYETAIDYAKKSNASEIHMVADALDEKKKQLLLKIGCIPTNERVKFESKDGILDMIVYRYC
ncbi:MAG TPA: GNAT family N-acetyltransferase [bacterium]|nr:GNAT family N-acetyltransferase [bacterium]HOL34757.1 GNAT family N-acetyltransferase [bacterium]HPP08477.1 GNAT family N-acetyltransferase [bacterium]